MEISESRRLFEIIAVVVTGFGKFLFVDQLHLKFWYILAASGFWVVYLLVRLWQDKNILAYWGFRTAGFAGSMKMIVPAAVVTIGTFVAYGWWNGTMIVSWDMLPVLALYPIWGVLQQFLIIGLIAGNLRHSTTIRASTPVSIGVAAVVFSLVHYPSWPLVSATFLLALFYGLVYIRHRNVWPLGIFHGWLGGLFYFLVLHRDPWLEFTAAIR